MKIALAFFAFCLFLAPVFARAGPSSCDTYQCLCGIDSFDQNNGMASGFIAVAFMLVSIAIALSYMYGKMREDEKAAVWAKDEAQNLLISVLLFAGLLVFFSGSCAMAVEYAKGSPFSVAKSYINTLLQNTGQNVLRDLTYRSIQDQEKATSYLYTGFTPFFGSGVAGQANYRSHSAHKELLIDMYLPFIASLNAQKYMLEVVEWVAASVLLPFAFVMRLIPPTRDFGNMLIALFFGLYIVAPTLYAMSGHVFLDKMHVMDSAPPYPPALFYSYGLDASTSDVRDLVLYKIGSTLPQAIFIPNLVILITITCVMSLSKALRAMAV